MKSTILKYLNNLLEFEENSLVNLECDLSDSECIDDWKDEVENELEQVNVRINELQECIKFLNGEIKKCSSVCVHPNCKEPISKGSYCSFHHILFYGK